MRLRATVSDGRHGVGRLDREQWTIVRSEQEKWQVPESDPAGHAPDHKRPPAALESPGGQGHSEPVGSAERAPLVYCGQCGGLNPAINHFCAACGATLIDSFHASEGLRVYERPDTASRLVAIVASGSELDLVDDPDSPPDFVRVKLEYGRLGYVRGADLDALAATPESTLGTPDINTNARGCITQTGALLAIVLMVMLSILTLFYISQTSIEEQGIVALAACVSLGPLLLVTIAIYIYARSRDERLEMEAEEAMSRGVEESSSRADEE